MDYSLHFLFNWAFPQGVLRCSRLLSQGAGQAVLAPGDAAGILSCCCFSSVWDKSSWAEGACFVLCGWKQNSPRWLFPDGLPAIVQGMVSGNKTGYAGGVVNVTGTMVSKWNKNNEWALLEPWVATWNICVSQSCHLPPLEFLGERSFYSFQCFGSRNPKRRGFVVCTYSFVLLRLYFLSFSKAQRWHKPSPMANPHSFCISPIVIFIYRANNLYIYIN